MRSAGNQNKKNGKMAKEKKLKLENPCDKERSAPNGTKSGSPEKRWQSKQRGTALTGSIDMNRSKRSKRGYQSRTLNTNQPKREEKKYIGRGSKKLFIASHH